MATNATGLIPVNVLQQANNLAANQLNQSQILSTKVLNQT
jgi:hypothetical protein